MKLNNLNKILKQITLSAIISLALLAIVLFWQSRRSQPISYISPQPNLTTENLEAAVRAIPLDLELDRQKIALGERLFYEVKLSQNKTISCASCHNLNKGGVDGKTLAIGINGVVEVFNTPTVFNSGFNAKQFWDGRANTLEELIEETINSPNEMQLDWPTAIARLEGLDSYQEQFKKIYRSEIKTTYIKDALATYLRSLSTPNSRFDRFLRGDETALNSREKQGYLRFQELGCLSCHQGINLGGNMLQSFGVMINYLIENGQLNEVEDKEIIAAARQNKDILFKVPTLRNIALTAPYFHDGSAATLERSITVMGKTALGRKLSSEDISLIVEFLNTLTGEYRGKML